MLLIAVTACLPRTSVTRHPEPAPTRTVIWGDSLTDQVVATTLEDGDPYYWRSHFGYELADWEDGETTTDVVDTMQRGATVAVLALGTAEILNGWDSNDVAVWSWVIASAQVDDDIVVILPWVTENAEQDHPGVLAERDEARAWLTTYAPHYVDWRIPVDEDPTILNGTSGEGDGIHAQTQAGVQARFDLTMEAMAQC